MGDSGQDLDDEEKRAGDLPSQQAAVEDFAKAEEISGNPGKNPDKEGLMHSLMEGDDDAIELGNMVMDAANNNVSFFTPEKMMAQFVSQYRSAKSLNNPSMIRQLTGYSPEYIDKNINIPEFKRHLQQRLQENFDALVEKNVLNKDGTVTEEAVEVSSVMLAMQEIDHLEAKGLIGQRVHKKRSTTGMRDETKPFSRDDTYRSINVAQSVKTAIRRGQQKLRLEDLRVHEKQSKGSVNIIYAIDTSGSMKGEKIGQAKRAGVALAYSAIKAGDSVGLLAFGKRVEREIEPCKDFSRLLHAISRLRASSETDLCRCIDRAVELFNAKADTNHLLLLTDALPTVGEDPIQEVLSSVSQAVAAGITVSVVGIGLDEEGEELARRIVDIGKGRVTLAASAEGLNSIVLQDYYSLK